MPQKTATSCPYHDPEFLINIAAAASARFDAEREAIGCRCPGAEELGLREASAIQYATVKALVCKFCLLPRIPECKQDSDFYPEG